MALSPATDANGKWPHIERDAAGRRWFAVETDGRANAFLYDGWNRVRKETVGASAVTYDTTGSHEYDCLNRLIRAVKGTTTLTFVYDGDGNRVQKTVNGQATWYLVDDRNPTGYAQVLEEQTTPGGDTPKVRYVYGLDLVAQTRNTGPAGSPVWTTHYFGYDGLGSVRYLTSASGVVTDTYTCDAFGIQLASTGAGTPNPYRFTGERWDAELGMYDLRARYYHPDRGRFWTMDTFEGNPADPLSLHKYLYCTADPVNRIDPGGMAGEGLGGLTVTMGNIVGLAGNTGIRAVPYLNRATVILFEAMTGNTVFVGGAGAVVALKHGSKLGGVGWATWQRIGDLLKRQKIGTYDEMAAGIRGNGLGEAANHLNQAAAFSKIPHGQGVSVVMGGPTSRVGASHNRFHQAMEEFWNGFRGKARGPTNADYDQALQKALEQAGQAADEASELVKLAQEARKAYGYFDGSGGLLPEIPGRMPLPR